MYGYGRQDIIKYEKLYFTLNLYYYQTYIFKIKKKFRYFFSLDDIESWN
jgi:hypothetical protein